MLATIKRAFWRALGFPNVLAGSERNGVWRDSDTLGETLGRDEGPFDNEQADNNGNQRKQRFHAVNVQLTSPRDAPDRGRLSILFDPTQVGIPVLGSRLGM